MRTLQAQAESWRLKAPFRISGYTFEECKLITVRIGDGLHHGRGEAAGVYYHEETQASLLAQIETVRDAIEGGADRARLHQLLPAGGARNALDCALWDLEAKQTGTPVWQLAGQQEPRPL